jgi:hypothetical protein
MPSWCHPPDNADRRIQPGAGAITQYYADGIGRYYTPAGSLEDCPNDYGDWDFHGDPKPTSSSVRPKGCTKRFLYWTISTDILPATDPGNGDARPTTRSLAGNQVPRPCRCTPGARLTKKGREVRL